MGEFEEALASIGADAPAAEAQTQSQQMPETAAPVQAQASPFEAALAEVVQQQAPEVSRDAPEAGGGMEH